MQSTARKNELPLDKMSLVCDVTKKQKEDFTWVIDSFVWSMSLPVLVPCPLCVSVCLCVCPVLSYPVCVSYSGLRFNNLVKTAERLHGRARTCTGSSWRAPDGTRNKASLWSPGWRSCIRWCRLLIFGWVKGEDSKLREIELNVLWDCITGHHPGQTGSEEHVRVSSVQDQDQRAHLHLDVQPEDQGQASQVDVGRSGSVAGNLIHIQN